MRKKVLLIVIALVTIIQMAGCGEQETNSNDTDVQLNQGDEQQEADVSDIEGVNITEEQVDEYVGVDFKWNISNYDLYALMRRQMEVKTDWFEGTVTYTDGHTDSISAEKVDLQRNGNILKVFIYYRGDESVGYEIEVPESWEDANYTEQSQEEIEEWYENLGCDSSVVDESNVNVTEIEDNPWDGVYSVADAPGLKDIDWDLFNMWMYENQLVYDDKLEINILQALGKDPRINNDWSELNSQFKSLYGDNEDGYYQLAYDLVNSYIESVNFTRGFGDYAILFIEPYRSNTDSGMYGEISEGEITNQEAYDKWVEENTVAVPEKELTAEEEYANEMASYRTRLSNLCWDLADQGIYTEEIWGEWDERNGGLYLLYDWLTANGYLSDPDGKYFECVTYYTDKYNDN